MHKAITLRYASRSSKPLTHDAVMPRHEQLDSGRRTDLPSA